MKKTINLSIYLIKKETEETIFKKTNLPSIKIGDGNLYIGESKSSPPKWRHFFNNDASLSNIFNKYPSAIFLVKASDRIFALSFGGGRHLLNSDAIEENFGFLTVLNLVDPKNLRSIDKKDMSGISKNIREQISKNGQIIDFGINIDRDLVYGVTGKSTDPVLGGMITGKDSLHTSLKNDCTEIKQLLEKYYGYYKSNKYKNNFPWIDNIKELRNKEKVKQLNDKLLVMLNDNEFGDEGKLWSAVPVILDWSRVAGFSFSGRKQQELKSDIFLSDFKEVVGEEKIDLDMLKNQYKVFCFDYDMEIIEESPWSLYSCLYCEIKEGDNHYFLNNKKWYEIDKSFIKNIQDYINRIKESSTNFIDYNYAVHNGEKGEGEFGYNKEFAKVNNLCPMDRNFVSYHGDQVEFCDAFGNKRIIHTKHYSGSAALSHLFNQGLVSGTLFKQEPEFRTSANAILCSDQKIQNIENTDVSDFEIIFGIISHSKKDLDLPIFSKITLTNIHKSLSSFGYKVTYKKIYNNKKEGLAVI